jgi:hypothetical protein
MAWVESGLFYPSLRDLLKGSLSSVSWINTTNKISLASASATPDFFGTTDPSTWTSTAEVTGTNWATGGIAFSAAGSGGGSILPTLGHTGPGPTLLAYGAQNIAVATTTISTPAFGAYLYAAAQSPAAMIAGIWFGGTGFTTVAGTFAITWGGPNVIATIACAA